MNNYEQLRDIILSMNKDQLEEITTFIIGKDGIKYLLDNTHKDDLKDGLLFHPLNYLYYLNSSYDVRQKSDDYHLHWEHDPKRFSYYQEEFKNLVEWVNTKHKND